MMSFCYSGNFYKLCSGKKQITMCLAYKKSVWKIARKWIKSSILWSKHELKVQKQNLSVG